MEEGKIRKEILEQFERLQDETRTIEIETSIRIISRFLNVLALSHRERSKDLARHRADLGALWQSQQQFIRMNKTNDQTAWQSFYRSVKMLKESFVKIMEQ